MRITKSMFGALSTNKIHFVMWPTPSDNASVRDLSTVSNCTPLGAEDRRTLPTAPTRWNATRSNALACSKNWNLHSNNECSGGWPTGVVPRSNAIGSPLCSRLTICFRCASRAFSHGKMRVSLGTFGTCCNAAVHSACRIEFFFFFQTFLQADSKWQSLHLERMCQWATN